MNNFIQNYEIILKNLQDLPIDPHCFVQLSGNPFPNSPKDAVAQLALARPDLYQEEQVRTLSALVNFHTPRKMRAAMHELLLCLDEPEDWEKHLREHVITLSPGEQAFYDVSAVEYDFAKPCPAYCNL